MKRLILGLICSASLLVTPVFADLEVPGEDNPILATSTINLGGADYMVSKRIENSTVTLKVQGAKGETLWTSAPLGDQEKLFMVDDQAVSIAAKDLTGDGIPELLTAAMTGESSSAFYVFKFDAEKKQFTGMDFKYEKAELTRDFMVSDMYQANGADITVMPENKIRALGKIYDEKSGPIAGFYYFKHTDGAFLCSEIVPVPVDEEEKTTEE